jgi:hypothetical protein
MDGIAHSLEVFCGARDNKELITVFFAPAGVHDRSYFPLMAETMLLQAS